MGQNGENFQTVVEPCKKTISPYDTKTRPSDQGDLWSRFEPFLLPSGKQEMSRIGYYFQKWSGHTPDNEVGSRPRIRNWRGGGDDRRICW